MYINEREFAQGVGGGGITVPRFGEAVLPVNAVSNLQRVFEQFYSAGETAAKPASYRLGGKRSAAGCSAAVPFEYQGEFDLRKMPWLEAHQAEASWRAIASNVSVDSRSLTVRCWALSSSRPSAVRMAVGGVPSSPSPMLCARSR